jgi:hypothetical protein
MPKVGKKEFAYTDKGKKAAEAYAKKTGKSVKGKKLNTTTVPGDGGGENRRRTTPPNIVKPTTPKFRPKLTKGAR